jgi:hypothetical protein
MTRLRCHAVALAVAGLFCICCGWRLRRQRQASKFSDEFSPRTEGGATSKRSKGGDVVSSSSLALDLTACASLDLLCNGGAVTATQPCHIGSGRCLRRCMLLGGRLVSVVTRILWVARAELK